MSFKQEFEKLKDNIKSKFNLLTKDDYKEQVQGYKHEATKRKKDNAIAMSILEDLESENRQPTKDELNSLLKYTGTGALGIGSKDEYYTPEYLAKSTWDLMGDLGDSADVLDPSAGVGIFGRNAPKNVKMKNIEYNGTSAKITDLTSDSITVHSSFEKESYNIQDNSLDGVVTNVPFGSRDKLLDTNKRFDKVTQHEHYFIMRSLELLKAGKRAVFIVPSSFISNTNQKEAKQKILEVGSFVGAIKLPNKVFSHSGANVCTDIVVFEKHPLNVVRNLQDRRYSPMSVSDVIYDDENNNGFLYGKYFEKNKTNVLGKFIKGEEFQNSEMFDGHNRSDQCITTDDMETIKEKIAKITKSKFDNTLEYDNLVALEGSVVIDTVAMEQLEKDLKDFGEYYHTMREKGTLTIKQLNLYIQLFTKLVNNEQANLLKTFTVYDYIAIPMYYNLFKKGYSKKEIVQFIKIGVLLKDLDGKKIENKKIIKTIQDNITQVKYISDKSNIKQLKFTKDTLNYELYNANIQAIFTRLSNGISTNWNLETNEPLDNAIEEIKTFASIMADKNINYDDIPLSEDGYMMFDNTDNKIFTADEILENKEIFIQDGKLIAKGDILYNGAETSDLKNYLENVKFEDSLGLTQEQFNEKLASIKASIEPHFEAMDINTLKLNQYNVTAFLPETAYPRIKVIKQQTIKDRSFLFIDSGTNVEIDEATDIVRTSFGIGQFFKQDDDDVSYMFDLYGDEIKKLTGALDKDNFLNTVRVVREKGADYKRDYLNKIRHIVHKHNTREIARYNIAIDSKVKNDKLLVGLLRENINKNNRVSLDQNEVSGRLNQMNEYVNTNILDTNHDYQNTDISNFSDSMSGIIAQDTGLGKTRTIFLTALNVVLKKKAKRSLIVVPTAIIDKWELSITKGEKAEDGSWKEEPILREDQKDLVAYVSNENKSSWNKLKTNKKARVVIMTSDSFKTLTFKQETLVYLMGDTQKEQEAKGGKNIVLPKLPEFSQADWGMAYDSKNSIGYFEEADIGFMIVDEAQDGKNSLTGGKAFKFGSSIKGSYYGNRLSLVSALLREKNGGSKGTVYATATPFTSSPYEIYTMLKNSGGLKNCRDLESFQKMFFITNERMVDSVIRDGEQVKVNVFEGLTNLTYLKQVGLNSVEYRSVETESKRNAKLKSIKPDYSTTEKIAEPTDDIIQAKSDLVARYELAKEIVKDDENDSLDMNKIEAMKSRFGLDFNNSDEALKIAKISSSFGTIDKLSKLAINKDFAYDKMVFNLKDISKEDRIALLEKILKKTIMLEEMTLKKDKSDGSWIEVAKNVKYKLSDIDSREPLLVDDILTIPVLDSAIAGFILNETKNDKGLLNIKDYPKYELLIENIREVLFGNSQAKQLVFSLNLTGAKIIEYFVTTLYKDLKIEAKLMSSLNIKSKKTEEDELGEKAKFQQEYNNEQGATVLIFTKAYSKGIDLNIMTTAVHLVDIPYSPDVWHQAMGRGVRQGNKTEKVQVFTYSQGGTVDTFKLKVLTEKSTWQDDLVNVEANSIHTASVNTEEVMAEAMQEFGGNATDEQIQVIYDRKTEAVKDIQKEEQADKNDFLYEEAIEKLRLSNMSESAKENYVKHTYDEVPDTATHHKQLDFGYKPQYVLSNIKKKGKLKSRIWRDLYVSFKPTLEETIKDIKEYDLFSKYGGDRYSYSYLGKIAEYVKSSGYTDMEKLTKYVENVTQEVKDEMIEIITDLFNIEEVKQKAIEEVISTSTNDTQVETLKDIKSGAKVMLDREVYSIDEVAKFYTLSEGNYYGSDTAFEFDGLLFGGNQREPYKTKPNEVKSGGYLSKTYYKYEKAQDNFNKHTAKMVRIKEENEEMINMYFDGKEPISENYNHSITDLSQLMGTARIIEDEKLILDNILEVDDFHITVEGKHYMKRDNLLYMETSYNRISFKNSFDYVDTDNEDKISFNNVENSDQRKGYDSINENSDFSIFDKLKSYSRLQNAIKDGLKFESYEYVVDGKSLYYPIEELIDFEEDKKKALELEELVNSDDKFNMSKDDLETIFNQGNDEAKGQIVKDILDGKYTQLKDFKKIKDRIDDEDYFYSKDEDKGILIDDNLNLLIYGTMPSRSVKKRSENIGISYSKWARSGYDENGQLQEKKHTWKTDINAEFLGRL